MLRDGGSGRLGYRPALDGVRALAILLVLGHHAVQLVAPERWHWIFAGGFLGVDIFFVLSGFLITGLLLEEGRSSGRIDFRNFYVRRALRLLPAVVVLLAVVNAEAVINHDAGWKNIVRTDAAVLLYVVNWFRAGMSGLGHLWSLSVEEQFYLVWPVVIAIGLMRVRRQWAVPLLLMGIATSASIRAALWVGADSYTEVYTRTDARADALLVGALAAVLWRRGHRLPATYAAPALVALLVAAATFTPGNDLLMYGGYTIVAATAAVFIVSLLSQTSRLAQWLSRPGSVHVGRISYGLYLWHVFTLHLFKHTDLPFVLQMLAGVVLGVAAAEASRAYVELPLLSLKDRFTSRPRSAAEGPDKVAGSEQPTPQS